MTSDGSLATESLAGRPVILLVLFGQLGFALFVALCVALSPHYVLGSNEGGISNFGVHLKTVVPYSVALLLPAVLTFRASRLVTPSNTRLHHLRVILIGYSVLVLLVLLSTFTYKIDTALRDVHVGVGVILTVFEMATSLWVYREFRALLAVLVVEFVGFVLASLTIFGVLHLLFVTQVLVGVAFAIFLVQACRVLTSPSQTSTPNPSEN